MIEIITAYWIKIFATLVVFVGLIILFLRSGGGGLNISGVEQIKNELDRLDEKYVVFDNVIVQAERGMLTIPYVVISPYGVFVITLCDLPGKISGDKDEREWQIKRRGVNDTILNPLWENRKHINALEKKLGSRPFIPVVVFTHSKLANGFGPIAVRVCQLRKLFASHTGTSMRPDNQKSVIAILNK
ncbi:MAG: nuclease-related domain-containing protein [Nitrospinaceae bacterium]|nr:nuclease-related domain-containing protein [Nitrospinaceae bacterium]